MTCSFAQIQIILLTKKANFKKTGLTGKKSCVKNYHNVELLEKILLRFLEYFITLYAFDWPPKTVVTALGNQSWSARTIA